jgi:hypothetical protein
MGAGFDIKAGLSTHSSDDQPRRLSHPLPRSALVATSADARRALLGRLIDHAPLFPPASLRLEEALAEDVRARESASAFALARFVCPASRLSELPDLGRGISVVLDAPFEPDSRVEAVEAPPGTDLDSLVDLAPEVYVEVALDDGLDYRLAEIAARGFRAKARCTDGPAQLRWFLLECRAQRLQYKLTGGLHHARRTGDEYGFLNVLAAVVFSDEDALDDDDPQAIELSASGLRWRRELAASDEVAHFRRTRLHSIGSCSFFEPVSELEALGVLPL